MMQIVTVEELIALLTGERLVELWHLLLETRDQSGAAVGIEDVYVQQYIIAKKLIYM